MAKKAKTTRSKTTSPAPPADTNGAKGWDDEFMTTRELMEFLSLSRTKIWDLVNNEGLPAYKIGGDYRYRRTEVLAWLEKYRVKK